MKRVVIGLVAHVDSGKTTLAESLLYENGKIRKVGRVDNGDAFLDTYALEKQRGITIFSKQATLPLTEELEAVLLDTPGHVDFAAEMERTLQVLDYAILLINAADGVQSHTRTLWNLLNRYRVPVFLFVNKMDLGRRSEETLLSELKEQLSASVLACPSSFLCENAEAPGDDESEAFYDAAAMCDEEAMEEFLDSGKLKDETIASLICERKLFPCFFGSALKQEGIDLLSKGISMLCKPCLHTKETGRESATFGARVFKIAKDAKGERLTYLKVTSGVLKVKEVLATSEEGGEKVNQIRVYEGDRFDPVEEAGEGAIVAVTGLTKTKAGQGLGAETGTTLPILEPVISYDLILPEGEDAMKWYPILKTLEEELCELHMGWDEDNRSIFLRLMGEVQTDVLKHLIKERYDIAVTFGPGNISYKETIVSPVEGVGHFEPLKHYAEVHLLLSPLPKGSGLMFDADVSEDELARNWQRLILTNLQEREHRGVLTGAPITDMRITVVAGRAHLKHTEGGDFRQAVYRGVRQGLMKAENLLLEPYYSFRLEVPADCVGRAMADLDRLCATSGAPDVCGENMVLTGRGPVSTLNAYPKEVAAYSKGLGSMTCIFDGYEPCHNAEEVLGAKAYDPEADMENPVGSVFCAHGAGFYVNWNKVENYMHLPLVCDFDLDDEDGGDGEFNQDPDFYAAAGVSAAKAKAERGERFIGTEEIDQIINKTSHANVGRVRPGYAKRKMMTGGTVPGQHRTVPGQHRTVPIVTTKYLLVDGYNVIFAWPELKALAEVNIDSARDKLADILCNYQAIKGCELILVFDAYRLQNHSEEVLTFHNITIVYTKTAETADRYIEKFAHAKASEHHVTVVTSDGMEQIIIRGAGAYLRSSREFEAEVKQASGDIMQLFREQNH